MCPLCFYTHTQDRIGSSDVIRSDLGQTHWLQNVPPLSLLYNMQEADRKCPAQQLVTLMVQSCKEASNACH